MMMIKKDDLYLQEELGLVVEQHKKTIHGVLCVQIHGEYKVAQFGMYDSNPYGSGVNILKFIRNVNLDVLESDISECDFYTKEQREFIFGKYSPGDVIMGRAMYKGLDTTSLEDILSLIMFGNERKLESYIRFTQDGYFCDWVYVIDFDKRSFEVYKANEDNLTEKDRFYVGLTDDETKQLKLVVSYSLDDLPTIGEFLDYFYPYENGV